MDRVGIHSAPRVDQHFYKCHPLQNAPLLLLNQARDIGRYGPLAPLMSLRKGKFNTDNVPYLDIEACRVPEWTYNHIPSHQKTTFYGPNVPGMSEFHQNNQYCQPLAVVHPTSFPLGRQEWMGRSVMPFPKEPLPTVSCWDDLNSGPCRSNTGNTFSRPETQRADNSAYLPLTQLQYNNEVRCIRHPTQYSENTHPYKAAMNDIQGSFHSSLSTRYDKRSTNNDSYMSMEINRTEEPLNLIVNSNQNSNQVPHSSSSSPLSSSSSLSSLSPSVSSSTSVSITLNHPLSVSSLSWSACTLTSSLSSNTIHSHKNSKLDQRHSILPSRGCNYIVFECCPSMIGKDHNKHVQNNNHITSPKEKRYASSNISTVADSFSKNNLSEANQSPSCDRDYRDVMTSADTIDTRHRAFQTGSRNFEYINMLNRERPNDYHRSISPVQENGVFSGLQQSNVRMNKIQDNLHPSLGASAVEEGSVAQRIGGSLQRNPSTSIPLTDAINDTISSHVGWKDSQELSAFKNITLQNSQRERDNSYAPQTELLSAKRNVTDDTDLTEKQYNRCTISKSNLELNSGSTEIRMSNQPLANSSKEFNSNRHNSIYPSFKIRPVRIIVGTSQNGGEVNQHISTTEQNIWDESGPFIGQSPPARSLMGDHRKESHMPHSVLLPGIQEKESNTLEEPRTKAAHCVSTIANPPEFNPSSRTDCDKRMNRGLEEKKYYYDLNTRDVVPHSPYLSTNSDSVNPYTSETDLPVSDHEINTFSCPPVNIPCHQYEPKSLFTVSSSGESVYNQRSQENDRAATQVEEGQPNYTILRRSGSDGRLAHSMPITIVGSQEIDSIPDSSDRDCPSNPTPGDDNSSDCNSRKHHLNYYGDPGVVVSDDAPWHDRTANGNTVTPQAHAMNCDDMNTETNSYDVWNNEDPVPSLTRRLSISNNAKNDSLSNNNDGNISFELPDRVLAAPPQNQDKSPLRSSEVTSQTDPDRSVPVHPSNKDNLLRTNGGANVVPSSASVSIQLPSTTSADRSVATTKTSDANAKTIGSTVLADSSEITNDNSNVLPQCAYCESIFSSTKLLQEHLKTHMVSTPYQCSHCSLGFVSKARLLRHIQLHMNAKPFKCDECKNLFSTVTAFHRHLHSKKHSGKNLFKCKDCGLSFVNEAYINLHYKTHTGEHPFQCEQCGNIFACKNNLKNHIMTHTGEKPYQCVHCAKRFVTNFSLKVHIRTHTKEYPYRCDICNKRFLCSSNMASHLRTHTGEKRHQCYKCGKFLSSWSGLQGHQRTHTKECPFSCDLCNKSFSSKFSLRIHHRIHSGENPHKCKYCDKCFSNSSNLQRHLRTHTGEKPYHCTYCGKTFCSSTYLKSHIRTHTGEKPHSCKFCGKGFSNTSCFKQHVKKHEKV